MESYQSNHIPQNPQVLQQKRSDDALSVGSDSAYSTDSGGKIILNTWDNLLNIEISVSSLYLPNRHRIISRSS